MDFSRFFPDFFRTFSCVCFSKIPSETTWGSRFRVDLLVDLMQENSSSPRLWWSNSDILLGAGNPSARYHEPIIFGRIFRCRCPSRLTRDSWVSLFFSVKNRFFGLGPSMCSQPVMITCKLPLLREED